MMPSSASPSLLPEYSQTNPKPLRTEFARDGLSYKQLKRTPRLQPEPTLVTTELGAAMYSVSGGGFEVIRIRLGKPGVLPNGNPLPWRETYPTTEEFGRHGWYFMPTDRGQAEAKYEALAKARCHR